MTSKNKIAALIMFLIGALIFWWEARKTNPHQMLHDLTTLNWWWLLVGAGIMFLSWVCETVVLQIMLKSEHEQIPFHEALRIPLVEQLFNSITPFAAGGQPAQLFAMLQSGIEGGRASSVLLMKFVVYQFMVLINFVFTMIVGFERLSIHIGPLAWLIVFGMLIHVAVIIGLLLVMYYYRLTKKLVALCLVPVGWVLGQERRAKMAAQLDTKIDTFYKESLHLKKEKKKVLMAAVVTLLQLLLLYSVPYFVLLSLHITHVNIIRVMVLHIMIVMIVSIFPIPGGSGGAEYSFKTIFATFISNGAHLVLAMLLWRFLTYYMGMIAGIIAVAVQPKRKAKQLPDEPHDE
ncbi:lysylphosphatidylglycerol synthase transmembrane domain-containing protein [Lacticaseibacillus pabuli]|uniref:Phosphatidylglycerol lysyltransferase n=1 Tax=Lacticaseibacillus pabuli TaxID=3025672 RepID=A0ABY7WSV1_9LACO|nr:lysylphosphatidylglycerol synthase transmembrane domain-containing protein [Lacticaseibacillus sp. KACC 23028]WDF82072.1 lysylphosphatidylglycerol synthase transmembrane domain-containing protein [Lacticaseibacillus sp. KACC 23028]